MNQGMIYGSIAGSMVFFEQHGPQAEKRGAPGGTS
jgi:hypothetical protein